MLLAAQAQAVSLGTVSLKEVSASPTQAAYIWGTATPLGQGPWLTGQYNLLLNPSYTPTGEGVQVYAEATNGIIGTFCADTRQLAPSGYQVYDVYMPEDSPIGYAMGGTKADDLRKLFTGYLGGLAVGDATTRANNAAAFQACVWEIINETTATYQVHKIPGTTKGSFYMDEYWGSGWLTTADTWLASLAARPVPTNSGLRVLVNPGYQDYALTIVPQNPNPPVPEPVTMAGLLMGLGAAATYVRRRLAR
jgi:hypothetical protein